ncbi:OLC1v1016378C1 [Oldenlandia corymbosa var. corymbosa]|uniref:OLC1v1016378C1 n=1 Tax=Oldenlandia corymbosa var. corymbosa TaxID=529605 RepID=A0AAV1E7E7_OLDCO|nr:OLC1v1016378C1 [Oldenlandia corymbosa var. corymbosa]
MSFTETVRLKVYWNTTYTTEPDGTITVQRDAPDGYLIIDSMLDFSELVDKVCGVMEVDREGLYIDFSLVWTERSRKRSRVHINDDNTVRFIYLCADKWPELYPENVERTSHVYASTSVQDIGASTSGGRTVESNEDGDEDEDKDEDADEDEDGGSVESSDDEYVPSVEDSDDDTDFESSSSVPYVFDDISGWDKTLEEVDYDGIQMWDGNPLTLDLDIHFANKPEAQAAVGEWNLVHGRTFRVKTSSKRTWYVECETCGPKYLKERLHGYDCLWKARVSLQKATDTWKMVANIDMIQKCQNVLPPKPMKLYEKARKKSLRQKVNQFSKRNQKYELVTIAPDNQPWKAEDKQVVLYANRECTCGRWQTFRFPCSHALRVARELGDDPFPLFDPCYTTHQWYQQFSGEFNPIMEPWPKATWQIRPDDTKLVHHAGRGRKRVNRKKGCGSLDHDAVECPFSHPPADRTAIDKLYDPYGIRGVPNINSDDSDDAWSREKKVQGITRFNLAAYRDQLAVLAESDFVWMPYTTLLGRIARRIPGDALLLTAAEITSLLKRKPFGGFDRRWLQQLGIYLQVWNDRHDQLVGTDDEYVGEPSADPEYILWYHQATLMEDVRSLSIIGQRTFDADSFGYDRLGEIAQVAERALSVNATNVTSEAFAQVSAWAWGARDNHIHSAISVLPASAFSYSLHWRFIPSVSTSVSTLFSTAFSPSVSTSFIPSVSTSFFADPTGVLPSDYVSPAPAVPFCLHSVFLPSDFSAQFGDFFIDFSGFQQSSLDSQSIHYTSNFLSSMFEGVAGQHQADDPAGGERESQGEDEAEDEAEDADQDDQFEGQGYQRHEEQGSSQTLGTPPLAVSKGQRMTKESGRLTYSLFRAKKPKKK